jgi:hypothetical protein
MLSNPNLRFRRDDVIGVAMALRTIVEQIFEEAARQEADAEARKYIKFQMSIRPGLEG